MIQREIEDMRQAASILALQQARMSTAMEGIARIAGFSALVAANRAELRRVATKLSEEGLSTDGWIA